MTEVEREDQCVLYSAVHQLEISKDWLAGSVDGEDEGPL